MAALLATVFYVLTLQAGSDRFANIIILYCSYARTVHYIAIAESQESLRALLASCFSFVVTLLLT